jgi:hypothetical protein
VGLLQEPCAVCGHSFSFHSKSATARCKAIGCHAGEGGDACTGFEAREDAPEELRAALSVPG